MEKINVKSINKLITKIKVKITLNNELLSLLPANKDIHTQYIQSKIKDAKGIKPETVAEELDNIKEQDDKALSIFHRDPEDGNIILLYDYQVKGFFKECGNALRAANKKEKIAGMTGNSTKWGSITSKIDNYLRITPRMIKVNQSDCDDVCERPLHAMTAQGPRTSIKKSETIGEGKSFEFTIMLLTNPLLTPMMLFEMLEYATLFRGFGQWRNAGKGTFSYEYEILKK